MEAIGSEQTAPRRAILPVLIGGLATTVLTLAGVWYLERVSDKANVMGWYADYVIPVGPLLVGIVAGIGYGLMSYRTGVKVSGRLLVLVLVLQLLAYFVAQYIQFERFAKLLASISDARGAHLSFWHWFDFTTRSFAWVEENGRATNGSALGAWGYGIRALEILGFTLGGLIVPGIMRTLPYCGGCGVYMKSRQLCVLSAGVKPRKVKKTDTEGQAAYAAEAAAALASGMARLEQIRGWVAEGQTSALQMLREQNKAEAKQAMGQTLRLVCTLVQCPLCRAGHLKAEAYTSDNPTLPQDLGQSTALRGLEI